MRGKEPRKCIDSRTDSIINSSQTSSQTYSFLAKVLDAFESLPASYLLNNRLNQTMLPNFCSDIL